MYNNPADSATVAGSVGTQAAAICFNVAGWMPTPEPTIVPAMPGTAIGSAVRG